MTSEEITKSKDPKLVASRVFLGNLASERTSREEIEEKFAPFGKILGISIHQGFGFVQFEGETEAQAAVEANQGNYFKGKKLDLRIANEGKKSSALPIPASPFGPRPPKRPHEDFMPRRPEFDEPGFPPAGRGPPGPWDRDAYGPPAGDDPFWRERFGPGPPPPIGGPPMDFRGEFGGPPPPVPLPLPPGKRVEYGVERPFDSVIVACNKHLKIYAEMVERKLMELNMSVDVIFLVHDNALLKAIDDMTRRGVLYILIVQPQNEEKKSVTVNIMHGTPQEHRNMPLEDALMMLARNFKTYLSSLRSGSEQPSMGFLLNLLSDGKHLSVPELDRIIAHLQDRRDRMIEAEGGKVIARDISSSSAAPNLTSPDQLQQRIFSILGNTNAPPTASANATSGSVIPPGPGNPASLLATMAQQFGLNLNSTTGLGGAPPPMIGKDGKPAVDPANLTKSLDSLLQNPMLKNLVSPPSKGVPAMIPFPGTPPQFSGPIMPQGKADSGIAMTGMPPSRPPSGPRGMPGPGF